MHALAVGEEQGIAGLEVGRDLLGERVRDLVLRLHHHDKVGPVGGLGEIKDRESIFFRPLPLVARRLGRQANHDFHARFAQVVRVGLGLRVVAYDRHPAVLDKGEVSVVFEVRLQAHRAVTSPCTRSYLYCGQCRTPATDCISFPGVN